MAGALRPSALKHDPGSCVSSSAIRESGRAKSRRSPSQSDATPPSSASSRADLQAGPFAAPRSWRGSARRGRCVAELSVHRARSRRSRYHGYRSSSHGAAESDGASGLMGQASPRTSHDPRRPRRAWPHSASVLLRNVAAFERRVWRTRFRRRSLDRPLTVSLDGRSHEFPRPCLLFPGNLTAVLLREFWCPLT